ncbi:MAG: hypothetical protein ACK6BG_09590 [Cyanobacteriota bacterium]
MLSDFQQALAEITASPDLCRSVRGNPAVLEERYQLTPRETRQVLAVARHPAMACACRLYRANRLAPLARNLPRTIATLAERLEPTLNAYWAAHPWPYRYGYLESERFCGWLETRLATDPAPEGLLESWRIDRRDLRGRLGLFLADSGIPDPSLTQ